MNENDIIDLPRARTVIAFVNVGGVIVAVVCVAVAIGSFVGATSYAGDRAWPHFFGCVLMVVGFLTVAVLLSLEDPLPTGARKCEAEYGHLWVEKGTEFTADINETPYRLVLPDESVCASVVVP